MKIRISPPVAAKIRWIEAGLLTAGLGMLTYFGYAVISARFFQAKEEHALERALTSANTARERTLPGEEELPARVPPPMAAGIAVGRIRIARIGLSVIAVSSDSTHDLEHAAGHIPGTAFPGQPGNSGFAAHRDTFFRPLRNVRAGDSIEVTTAGGTFRYKVSWTTIVPPDAVWVLKPGKEQELTLVTCYPFNYIGAAPERFIVRARRVTA
ncbi:MAG: class D sortase [Bryobacterales bacterium]|nr:class D sortase [Bryobacterales bacterium]